MSLSRAVSPPQNMKNTSAFRERLQRILSGEAAFGYLLLIPALLLLAVFQAYPFVYGVYLSLTNARAGEAIEFVGLANYEQLFFRDPVFGQVVVNTIVYTVVTEIGKIGLGLVVAQILNRAFRFRTVLRALFLLPWIVPTVLSVLAWSWIFDPHFGVLNWTLKSTGLIQQPLVWLYTAPLPMVSVIIVNIWRGIPFSSLAFLGAMQAIPSDYYEAAMIDGATSWQQYRYVTLPMLRPVLLTVGLLTTIATFSDFQIIHILTGGGPNNMTQVFSTYAYRVGLINGNIGMGAAVSLTMFPVLAILTGVILWLVRRD